MKYSNKILNDDNFDEELEKLVIKLGFDSSYCNNFVKSLDDYWVKQEGVDGCDEYVKAKLVPNPNANFKQGVEVGQIAYEFGNGFIVFDYEGVV